MLLLRKVLVNIDSSTPTTHLYCELRHKSVEILTKGRKLISRGSWYPIILRFLKCESIYINCPHTIWNELILYNVFMMTISRLFATKYLQESWISLQIFLPYMISYKTSLESNKLRYSLNHDYNVFRLIFIGVIWAWLLLRICLKMCLMFTN